MFPYYEARKILIELIEKNSSKDIKAYAELMLNLHLRHDTLAMPIMTASENAFALEKIRSGCSLDEVCSHLIFEQGETKNGIFRVLVRTHLNRSGINDVSMGCAEKTLSPRILSFTDTINLDENNWLLIEEEIIPRWLEHAKVHRNTSDLGMRYNEDAIYALETLNDAYKSGLIVNLLGSDIHATKNTSGINLKKYLGKDIKVSWIKIVLGILTGLRYLHHRQWDVYKRASDKTLTYKEINNLILDCQQHVCEYGYALAGSFLADLGSPNFVKDDTHVRECVSIFSEQLNTPEKRVKAVIDSAHKINVAPRILDKVMYIAGSGNLYLLGVKLKNSQSMKKDFIERLKNSVIKN